MYKIIQVNHSDNTILGYFIGFSNEVFSPVVVTREPIKAKLFREKDAWYEEKD